MLFEIKALAHLRPPVSTHNHIYCTHNHFHCIMSENNKKRSINDVLVWNNKKVAANSIQPLIFGELIGDIDHEQGDESV